MVEPPIGQLDRKQQRRQSRQTIFQSCDEPRRDTRSVRNKSKSIHRLRDTSDGSGVWALRIGSGQRTSVVENLKKRRALVTQSSTASA